jgi:hypothetical protein
MLGQHVAVGSKGSRPRKKRRPSRAAATGPAWNEEPPVMWPAAGSGFEASSFSPAGRAQQVWAFARGASSSEGCRRIAVRLLVVLFVLVLILTVVAAIGS